MAIIQAFEKRSTEMRGRPEDIDDTMTRSPGRAAGVVLASPAASRTNMVAARRTDMAAASITDRVTASTPRELPRESTSSGHVSRTPVASGMGSATVEGNNLIINMEDLTRMITAAQADPTLIGKALAEELNKFSAKKRKSHGEDDEPDEEPPIMVEETFEVKDDGHDTISWPVRLALQPINREPSEIWKKSTYPMVTHPILGGTLYTEHLFPGQVNTATVKLRHDRGYFLTVNEFSHKNSSILLRSSKKMHMNAKDRTGLTFDMKKKYEECKTVYEVVTSFLNYVALEQRIRPHSHEALTILRVLHDLRWLSEIVKQGFNQKVGLEKVIHRLWHLNTVQAQQSKAPLTYQEAKKHALDELGYSVEKRLGAEEQGNLKHIFIIFNVNFCTGDPYCGSRAGEIRELKEEVKSLKNKIQNLEAQKRNGGNKWDRGTSQREYGKPDKNADVCKKFNEKDGCKSTVCNKRHVCTKKLSGNHFCWRDDHGEYNHR